MTEGLTLEYRLKSAVTTVTVVGTIDAPDCPTLRDGLDFARSLRSSGPIVVDLGGVDRIALAALVILDRAAADARRAGRVLCVRNLRQENITDPLSLALLEGVSQRPSRRRRGRWSRRHWTTGPVPAHRTGRRSTRTTR
jgi:anti-anti-sigma regulatory factor